MKLIYFYGGNIMKKFVPLFGAVLLFLTSTAVFGGGRSSATAAGTGGSTEVTWFHTQLNQPNITYYNDAIWKKELGRRFDVTIRVLWAVISPRL
jgi:ABC-type glycerol-3-phosphate transport system substrate-binding protein